MLRFRALRRLAPDWPATLRDNLRWYRDVFLVLDEVTPRQVRTTRDAYAGGRDDLSRRRITLRNREFSRGEILAVVGQVDAEGLGQAAGAVAEVLEASAPPSHEDLALDGTQCPDENSAPHTFRLADDVE